jgi:hypothetical protein
MSSVPEPAVAIRRIVHDEAAVSNLSLGLYLIYTILIGVSVHYTDKLHTLIMYPVVDSNTMTAPPLSSEQKQRANNALILTWSYVIIWTVFILGYIFCRYTIQSQANPAVLGGFTLIILLMQLSSFGILNQYPEYEFARKIMGKNNLTAYQGLNGAAIGCSIMIILLNFYTVYKSWTGGSNPIYTGATSVPSAPARI